MSRKALVLGLVLCQGLALSLAAVAGPFLAEDPPTTPGKPFSAVAEMQSTTVFADGNRIVRTNTVRYFRDSQGRTRVERGRFSVGAGADQPRTVIIRDPISGELWILNSRLKTATGLKWRPGVPVPEAAEDASLDTTASFGLLGLGMSIGANPGTTEASSDTTSLGQQVISGVSANGTRLVRTIASGALGNDKPITSTLERWLSPELGVPVQVSQKSSIGGTLTLSMKNIVRAEPAPALFTVPADYRRQDLSFPVSVSGTARSTDGVQAQGSSE